MKNIKKLIFPVLLAALTVTCFCFQLGANKLIKKLPDAVAFRSAEGLDYSFDELITAQQPEGSVYSGARFSEDYISVNDLLGRSVSLVKTDEGYSKILNPIMLRGGWFEASYVPEANKVAVISDRLAVELFLTDDAVGRTFSLAGAGDGEYTVCGVYKEGDTFIDKLSSTGKSEVFIPWKQNSESVKPQLLYVMGNNSEFSQSVDDELKKAFGRPLYAQSRSDYREATALAVLCVKGTIFFCAVLVVILLFISVLKNGKRAFYAFKGGDRQEGIKCSVITAVTFAVMLTILLLAAFKPEIPNSYLPYDNIFDFDFYIQALITQVQASNASGLFDYYQSLGQNALTFLFVFGVSTIIFFYFTCIYNLRYIAKVLWQFEE